MANAPGVRFRLPPWPAAPGFEVADVLPELTRQAERFIEDESRRGGPFFLYLPLPSPHTPLAPTAEWKGRSGLNLYADFVMQTDAAIGQLLAALERSGVADNTLFILTSDNGCAPQARIHDLKAKGHDVSGGLRGNKADLYDGGVRVPFLARWPDRARPAESGQLICLTDLFATFAELVDADVPAHAAEDSFSFAPALLSRPGAPAPGAGCGRAAFRVWLFRHPRRGMETRPLRRQRWLVNSREFRRGGGGPADDPALSHRRGRSRGADEPAGGATGAGAAAGGPTPGDRGGGAEYARAAREQCGGGCAA